VRPRSDRGAATVWVLGLAAVVVAVALAVVLRASAVLARHRLESATDLAALAGAQQIGRLATDQARWPCAAAARVAAENGAILISCAARLAPSGRTGTVAVVLSRPVRLPLVGTRTLSARSRAGRLPAGGIVLARPSGGSVGDRPLRRGQHHLQRGRLVRRGKHHLQHQQGAGTGPPRATPVLASGHRRT